MSDVSGSSRALRALLLCAIAAVTGACGAEGGTPPTMTFDCARNEQQACACAGGVQGVQRCGADRMWGECMCGDAATPADAGAPPDEGDGCRGSERSCAGSCVDVRSDRNNCGRCGLICSSGEECAAGACVINCPSGQTACGSSCADTQRDGANCGACGVRCGAGQACTSGACVSSEAPVQVQWLQGLWPAPRGELWLPTYLLHLYGVNPPITDPLRLQTICANLSNRTSAAQQVVLEVRAPGLAETRRQNVSVPAGATVQSCVDPVWDLARLQESREFIPGTLEAYARLSSGTELSSAMQPFSAMPTNGVVWSAEFAPTSTMDLLSSVYVMPNEPRVLELRAAAERRSAFAGGFGDNPYVRQTRARSASIAATRYDGEVVALYEGEALSWALGPSVTGGSQVVDVYLFNSDQFAAWTAGTSREATFVWANQRASATGTFTSRSTGVYTLVVKNTATSGAPLTFQWNRTNTRYEVASDALGAIFGELRARGTRYVNISAADRGAGLQLIRRPRETIDMRAANCVDGTLVFASVLENIGMQPVLLYTPNHAFVGVRTSPGGAVLAIETTMVGGAASVSDALVSAEQTIQREAARLSVIDVTTARTARLRARPQ